MAFLSAEMGRNATSTRQTRFASVQLGQQLQDVVIQAQMGTNAFVILAQQGSQAAYALTGMGGAVGRLASFMAGWQGAIVLAAVALAGPLVSSLMSASRAAGETADALGKVKFSSSDLSNAQSILGTVMDTATGKMKVQREELIALGIAHTAPFMPAPGKVAGVAMRQLRSRSVTRHLPGRPYTRPSSTGATPANT